MKLIFVSHALDAKFSSMSFSWETTQKPILVLAPMAGYTDSAFRQIVKKLAPDTICFTELTSINALEFSSKKTEKMLNLSKSEHPLIVQIFGNTPEFFANAAQKIEKLGIAGIDINMGCPARKIIKNNQGSALIKNPKLAAKIVEAVCKAIKIPVSVKTRIGFLNYDEKKFISFCKGLESAGAKTLTIHGRTVSQGFSGKANWNPIYSIKEHLKIPVIGNGDVNSGKMALEKLKNLDGIMVGRSTFGNPWIMAEISAALKNQKYTLPQKIQEKIPLILEHCQLSIKLKGEKSGILEMRKHLSSYIRGFSSASKCRSQLVQATTFQEIEKILKSIPI